MSEEPEKKSISDWWQSSDLRQVIVFGTFVVIAAVLHACLSGGRELMPLHVGTILGDVHVRSSPTSVSHLKLGGCEVECFESFVVVYIDSEKQPTWTGNYVKTIPWSKIEYMTLADPNSGR